MNYITKKDLALGPQFGSQMGQFAGLYSISKRTGHEIVFLDRYMNIGHGVKLFDAFDLKIRRIDDNGLNFKDYFPMDAVIDESVFTVLKDENWNFGGCFHTFNYWHNDREDLLKIFTFRQKIVDKATEYLSKIKKKSVPTISVHFRRTDYLQVSSLNLKMDYYSDALGQICSNLRDFDNYQILVFSDDIDWCKQVVKGENVFYSEGNSNYVDMCMMTMCDHNIIANSTFSWWGAYLNANPNKMVACPKQYVGKSDIHHQFINGNYYPKEWNALDVF